MRIAGRAMAMVLGLLAGLFGGGARADIASGIRAYDRGDYPAALRAFEAGADGVDGGLAGEPEEIALGDRVLQVLAIAWIGTVVAAVYFA